MGEHLCAWAWARKDLSADITPLVAGGLALRGHATRAHLHHGEPSIYGISIAIYGAVLLVATLMLVGIPLLIVGVIGWVVLASLAVVKASQGQAYRYPLTLRLVR
jgi:hypothetical protein